MDTNTDSTQPSGSVPDMDAIDNGAVAPVSSGERIASLDFIRGIAVMGILAANIVAFGQMQSAYMMPEAFMVPANDPGGWMWIAQYVLIDGKMRALFTILFGAGLYLFMERTWARGGTRARQAWRLTVLMAFGLVHFFLIWFGDILFYYGLFGLVALLFLRLSAKAQYAAGLVGYIAGALIYAGALTFPYLIAETSFGESEGMADTRTEMIADIETSLAEERVVAEYKISGDYVGWVQHRFSNEALDPFVNSLFFILESLPLMLIGMAIYRFGFFNGGIDRGLLVRWGWIGFLVGGAIHLAIALFVKAQGFTFYSTLGAFVGWSPLPRLFMALGLAALLAAYAPAWTGWLGSRVSAAGRTAFTNYLGTSVIMLFVFHGFGLGLFGQLDRPQLYLVTALTCGLMLLWSKPWLERYRYGPLEWLWRCLTYGKMFANKR